LADAESWYGPQLPGVLTGWDDPALRREPDVVYQTAAMFRQRPTVLQLAEQRLRQWIPGTVADDFFVGAFRGYTGTIGKNGNPTWEQAWKATDRSFGGYLPGGVPPENPLKLLPDWVLPVALAVGVIALVK